MVNNNRDSEDNVCKGVKRDKMSNQDQLDLPKEEIKIELKRRHDEKVERNEKRQKVMVIAEKINVSVPEELLSTDKEEETRNKETLRQEMITEKRQYIAKIELGKMISCIIDEEHIPELCMNKEKQEALLLYRRYNECLDN